MTIKNKLFFSLLGLLCIAVSSVAQQRDRTSSTDTIKNYSAYKRTLRIAGVLQTRYVYSLTDDTDVNGKNFAPADSSDVTNTFLIKRARVMLKGDINDHFSANILVNLADFSGDPTNKVLENAYIKYSLNKYFHVQAGQFRPAFGIEDAIAVDVIRTLDFSNQYYAFGKNGWQSFQIGISVLGDLTKNGTARYFIGVYNGNNKNQKSDDNNSKNTYARVETDLGKSITLGANFASGSMVYSGTGSAYGADMTARIPLSEKFQLLLMAEAKVGSNFLAYNTAIANDAIVIKSSLTEYQMRGFYILPTLRYDCRTKRVRAIEFSSRYEYFDENYKMNSNARQTIIPNLSLIFADDFYAALQMGLSLDWYKKEIPLTLTNSHNLAYVQLQIRF
ncbi:MAG: porin [Flavobacterium sp.]